MSDAHILFLVLFPSLFGIAIIRGIIDQSRSKYHLEKRAFWLRPMLFLAGTIVAGLSLAFATHIHTQDDMVNECLNLAANVSIFLGGLLVLGTLLGDYDTLDFF